MLAGTRAELTRAQARVEPARLERARAAQLLASRTISQGEFDRRATTHRDLEAQVEDDAELRASVFARLRPTAPSWAGTLIVIELDAPEPR